MEKTNLHYSTKNIPVANDQIYKLMLIEKIEAVIKRMRWKAIFFEETDDKDNIDHEENYGLKSKNTPKQIPEMVNFEKELIEMARNVKFRKGFDDFQLKMKTDLRNINSTQKVFVQADKTSNMYKLTKANYEKHLSNAITKTYKKAERNLQNEINLQGKELMKDHSAISRMSVNAETNSFITLKDHKENFENHPTTRLINPAKNEVGRISKHILENLNKTIRETLMLNQWKSTKDVTDWFKNINDKHLCTFMMFDIKEFYPSISENLLKNALKFANDISRIKPKDMEIIFHARKSLLFNSGESWMKKGDSLFDVTMGAFDGAEVCELVGCFLLHLITRSYDKNNVGLYRDDGLAVFKNANGQQCERIKKNLQKLFKNNGLEIIAQCNMKIVNFLDITLNLTDSTFRPYHKDGNETNYVHVKSNHPPCIIKQIPLAIEKRLSNLSSNEEIFKSSTPHYEEALKRSGYTHKFQYNPDQQQNRNRNRKRKIIWFNPPFNKNVSTPIAKQFLNIAKKHFPKDSKFHKIFNKNTIKVSYSCMPNIKSIISSHNKKILNPPEADDIPKTCNCVNPAFCPLNQNCLATNIIYEATLTSDQNEPPKSYIGLSETTFKKR